MTTVLIVLGCLVGLVAALAVLGSFLPKGHVASVRIRLGRPAEAVWEAISDFEGQREWRGLKKVERLPDRDGK
ncbi:MAG: SRPBCC family protein, partial [Planctomycetota bacterium]